MTQTPAHFAKDRSGVAATEFALLLPVLLLLFFGVVEGSDALAKSRRVSLAANTLADLAARERRLMEDAADDLFAGVEEIVDINGADLDIRLVSVIAGAGDADGDGVPDGDPVVHWSYDNRPGGGAPYAAGAAYTTVDVKALLEPDASIIVAEVDYTHASGFGGHVISAMDINRTAVRWPRRSLRIQLCKSATDCVD